MVLFSLIPIPYLTLLAHRDEELWQVGEEGNEIR